MIFKNNMAAAIQVKGSPIKEKVVTGYHGEIQMDFGSEYAIMLHNYGATRAKVNISIDGADVMTNLVVGPNEKLTLDRYLDKPNKFKFIARSKKVEAKRGIRIEDGLVRISYKFEKQILYRSMPYWYSSMTSYNTSPAQSMCTLNSIAVPKDGITVQGSRSDQQFSYVPDFEVEPDEYIITFDLKGTEYKLVDKQCAICFADVTNAKYCPNCGQSVEIRPLEFCPNCGTNNPCRNKFCKECGTNLE